jgi:hypothetical protein
MSVVDVDLSDEYLASIDYNDIAQRVDEFGEYGKQLLSILLKNGPMLYTHLQNMQTASPAKYKPVFKSLYTCGFINSKPLQPNLYLISSIGKKYLNDCISESGGC